MISKIKPNSTINTNHTKPCICLRKVFNFFHQRRAGVAQELRYSAIEVANYIFRLKCLVPKPLQLVRKQGFLM